MMKNMREMDEEDLNAKGKINTMQKLSKIKMF
jgi:hypothetical protein